MATTHFTGPVESTYMAPPVGSVDVLFQTGDPGTANAYAETQFGKGAIADNTATDIFKITVPNNLCSCVFRLLVRTAVTAVGHVYESTRVVGYYLTVTRIAGAAMVAVISAAVGAQIATSAGGSTLTTGLTVSAVAGGVTAINSVTIQATNVGTPAGISETQVWVEMMNGQNSGITMTQM